ncbi:MAG: dihydropteroate synthase [Candidatus Omnitrophica bacterium]|nr:dihydropteroate synthase [Candidatus Omnitrophota bacterium]
MQDIRVDPYGIGIMWPKSVQYLLKVDSVSSIAANILKQEMLSLGGDTAVCRDALTGRAKKTDCLIMGNLAQFRRLIAKLKRQPLGLGLLAQDLSQALRNYQNDNFSMELGRFKINLSRHPLIMGILNITPDSFSGDGLLFSNLDAILSFAEKLVEDGADIIDIGGESSRPGAKPVPLKEELRRAIPVIKVLAKRIKVPISIDTYKPQVAQRALDNGALIVNDISGLRNDIMPRIISRYKAGVVIMHMKGRPLTMQNNPRYSSLIDDIIEYLTCAIRKAKEAGIEEERIIIDPGIGFGKTHEDNLMILNRLGEFRVLGRPILVGASRKSFIGKLLGGVAPQERINGTIASCVTAVKNGAKIVRVHDVRPVKEALKIVEGIENIW